MSKKDLDKTYSDTWAKRDIALRDTPYPEYLKSEEWLKIKLVASKRDHYQRCYICDKTNIPLEIHHRTYKWIGTPHAMRGLVAVCRRCHEIIHQTARDSGISVRRATNQLKKKFNN